MDRYSLLKKIGHICMMHREATQTSIRRWAKKSKTTHQSLAAFERGETNSLYSFLSYLPSLTMADMYRIRRLVEDYTHDDK